MVPRPTACMTGLVGRATTAAPAFVFAATACLTLLAAAPSRANMVRQIITGKCSQAMRADFKKAAKNPPAGMVDFTCGCVADGMLNRRQSLEQAKTVCVQQATQKYGAI
ncbi:MAG: hypothetical protein VKL23_01720 [Cyanobacteriota bacterium]|jgi:hypothetical protein|nr:hypothetical protein [Cyanobacteriota bacterium]